MRKSLNILLITAMLLAIAVNTFAAKNVILLIGDGMGENTVKMTGCYLGKKLSFEAFPTKLHVSTFQNASSYDPAKAWIDSTDKNKPVPDWKYLSAATDSAAAATAINSGKKTVNGALNLLDGKPFDTIALAAKRNGYSVGDITSVTWTHATPAGVIAHNDARSDSNGIAIEMINSQIADVIAGAGHPFFNGNSEKIEKPNYGTISENLWNELLNNNTPYKLVCSKDDIKKIADKKSAYGKYLITYETDSVLPLENNKVPTLADVTKAALNIVKSNGRDKGFYIMIEGGAIDWANHANDAKTSIKQAIEFDKAVQTAIDWVNQNSNWNDSLIIVTADHETGQLDNPNGNFWVMDKGTGNIPDLVYKSGGHSNMLVPLYAKGANSNKFKNIAVKKDPVYGKYIDNTNISKIICDFMDIDIK